MPKIKGLRKETFYDLTTSNGLILKAQFELYTKDGKYCFFVCYDTLDYVYFDDTDLISVKEVI